MMKFILIHLAGLIVTVGLGALMTIISLNTGFDVYRFVGAMMTGVAGVYVIIQLEKKYEKK